MVIRCFNIDLMPESRAREYITDPEAVTIARKRSTRKVKKCQHNATPPIPGLMQLLSTY